MSGKAREFLPPRAFFKGDDVKSFTAHRRPEAPPDRVKFVKDGFSWPAFFFSAIWLVAKRLWLALALYVLAILALSAAASATEFSGAPLLLAILGLNLFLGFEANDINRRALLRRGYAEEGPFIGGDVEEAELLYFRLHPAAAGAAVPPPSPGGIASS